MVDERERKQRERVYRESRKTQIREDERKK